MVGSIHNRPLSVALCLCLAITSIAPAAWELVTPAAPWSARSSETVVSFQDELWLVGGWDAIRALNDVWHSADGQNWTRTTAAAPWIARNAHTSVVFNDRVWIFGGRDGSDLNDVWYTPNGVNWTQATSAAPWISRVDQASAVFDGRMWILGGEHCCWSKLNDVWYSTNGTSWILATDNPGWSARDELGAISYDGRLWVLGASPQRADVWSSSDGASWRRETNTAPWGLRNVPSVIECDARMWLLGGMTTQLRNDVWHSQDGINWMQQTASAGWRPRFAPVTTHNGSLWIMGGYTSVPFPGGVLNDVWTLPNCGICTAPIITDQPRSVTVCEGTPITLTIGASGDPPPDIQWRINGVGIPGANGTSFTIPNPTISDGGGYDVVVSNACGSVISDAAVILVWPIGGGDVTGDGLLNAGDLSGFIQVIIAGPSGLPGLEFCAADLDSDGDVDGDDLDRLIAALLAP